MPQVPHPTREWAARHLAGWTTPRLIGLVLLPVLLMVHWTGTAAAAGYGIMDLGTLPGGPYSSALAINDLGQVVGYSTLASGDSHAFLWQAGTGMRDLGNLPNTASRTSAARAINDVGRVVGESYTAFGDYQSHAFLWEEGAGMQDLGTPFDGDSSVAYGINSAGQIVGQSSAAGAQTHAVLWTRQ
jgi:probable HAF family extracellular repeat protein